MTGYLVPHVGRVPGGSRRMLSRHGVFQSHRPSARARASAVSLMGTRA